MERVDGKLYAKHYEVRNERVQAAKDMAVLTYQLYCESNLININYNCIEVFQKEEDDWHVIHSTWSVITVKARGASIAMSSRAMRRMA